MPELHFKGKEFVYNHHLSVPYRPLVIDDDKSVGATHDLNGNLIIHGDNLHALKALLPLYAGKVDCVFIDPPYNTGNEGWCYNDNVNSPMLKEWLASNPVGIEDGLRHDKWLAMMYPRIKLLHELLSEVGSFWMTLDDNEVHRAKQICDEIFGESNFVANLIWQKKYSPQNDAKNFSSSHDHILCYAKQIETFELLVLPRTEEANQRYKNPDNDPRGPWKSSDLTRQEYRERDDYEIISPMTGKVFRAPKGNSWGRPKSVIEQLIKDNRVWFGPDGNSIPSFKRFLSDVKQGITPQTIFYREDVGDTQEGKKEIKEIFGDVSAFETPKPVRLIERIITLAADSQALILDSFAGSGTTAHAVLEANRKDGGNRRFILAECMNYADTITAERVRRVMNGYDYVGTQRDELHREKLSFTHLKKADKLLDYVASIENLQLHNFDAITKEVKDGELVVTGEKKITARAEGLGGSFAYCTLGDPLDLDGILTGENLPSYDAIGAWLFHTATGEAFDPARIDMANWYLGESAVFHVWLIYKPELAFLKSREAALTLNIAEAIAKAKQGKKHLVFAPAKYVPNKTLLPLGVEYAPLPFSLYRLEK